MKTALTVLAMTLAAAFYAHAQTAPAATLNDREVAETLITINEGEIDAGKIAAKHAQNADVKNYAKMMVDEHKKNEKDTKTVAKNAKIDPKDNDFAEGIEKEAKNLNKDLKKTAKKDFDKMYISQQIKMHERALATITDTLLPSTTNPELRAHLEKTQAAVKMHLEHAQKLNASVQ